MANTTKIAQCEGRDRFLNPSTLVALLKSDLSIADEQAIHAKSLVVAAQAAYKKSMMFKRNIVRRLESAENNPRQDVPDAFVRLIGGSTSQQCIEWDGIRDAHGYGKTYIEGRPQLAHRVAFALFNAVSISAILGVVIRHKCDNPCCINPDHLEPGTQADNVHDMHSRGREGHGGARGSSNASAKLSESDIPAIRQRLNRGETQSSIAASFGVSKGIISKIHKGINWRHV